MISLITGKIHTLLTDSLIIMTAGGVGYEIKVTSNLLSQQKAGETITLPTYHKVSDTSQELFGFANTQEKAFFILLLSISGVGPKSAMNILALGSIDDIQSAIARGDIKYLTAVQGLGKKTAERMIVELKSKVGSIATASGDLETTSAMTDVIDALESMGYSKDEIRAVLKDLDQTQPMEVLLKQALQYLSIKS